MLLLYFIMSAAVAAAATAATAAWILKQVMAEWEHASSANLPRLNNTHMHSLSHTHTEWEIQIEYLLGEDLWIERIP